MRESFLVFITEHEKTTNDIKKMILDQLEKEKLDFKNVDGQDMTMRLVGLEFVVMFNVFYET